MVPASPPPPQQLALDLPGPSPSLENFVPGRNAEALAVLRGWVGAERQSRAVYLWGLPGSGKSHLTRALADALAPASRRLTPASPLADFEGRPADGGLRAVIVDDADRLDAPRQQALFGLINRQRADPHGLLLATGARPPLALDLRDDLRSRLGWGLVFELTALDDHDKALALQTLASERGVMMSAEVVPYLLTHTSRDMRELIGLFEALDRLALQRQRAITLPLLRDLLQAPTDTA